MVESKKRGRRPGKEKQRAATMPAAGKATPPSDGRMMMQRLFRYFREQEFRVGDRLPSIRNIAESLEVNSTSVRDGMMAAQAMGVVRIQPRSGAFLQTQDFSFFTDALSDTIEIALSQKDPNLFHLIETRSLIETRTVEIAAARRRMEDMLLLRQAIEELRDSGTDPAKRYEADEKFHLTIAAIAGNTVLVVVLRAVLTMLHPYRFNQLLTDEDRDSTLRGHEQIYRLILNGDINDARTAMHEHVTSFWDAMLNIDPESASQLPDGGTLEIRSNPEYLKYLDSAGA